MIRSNSWPTYSIWSNMKGRCTRPNQKYWNNYGGRGITFCDRWKSFDNFLADMGERPSPKHSLDRIDVNGNYEPQNCRWATKVEQQGNRRDTVFVIIEGAEYKRIDLAKTYGVKSETISDRAAKGLTFAEVVFSGRYARKTATPEAVLARRKYAEAKTHCKNGHPFEGYNLVMNKNGVTKQCRICRNETARKSSAKIRALNLAKPAS